MLAVQALELAGKSEISRYLAPRIRQYAMSVKLGNISDTFEYVTKSGKKVVKSGLFKTVENKEGKELFDRRVWGSAKDEPWFIQIFTPKSSRDFAIFDGKLTKIDNEYEQLADVNRVFTSWQEKEVLQTLQKRISKIFNKHLGPDYLKEVEIPERDFAQMVRKAQREYECSQARLIDEIEDFADISGL